MTDDIVTRLQDHPHTLVDCCTCVRCEAAAEIERLRQLIGSVAPLLSSYGDGGVIYPDEAQIIAAVQQEARRG
jgi:hypothetical protein